MPPELSAPSWSLKRFNVTNDAKALTQHRYLQSGDYGNGFEIYHFYRRNKIVIKCVIRATVSLCQSLDKNSCPRANALVQRFLARGWQTDRCPHTHMITISYSLQALNYQNSECCDEVQFDYLEIHINTFVLYLMLSYLYWFFLI